MTSELIGIAGLARSGKSTAAQVLVEAFGYTSLPLADKVRQAAYALNPLVADRVSLQQVVDHYGWEGVKGSAYAGEVRRLLQRMGTEVGRELLGEDIWIDQVQLDAGRVVIPDVRFINEAQWVLSRGGTLWFIDRPDLSVMDHASEKDAPTIREMADAVIYNDSNLDEFTLEIYQRGKYA